MSINQFISQLEAALAYAQAHDVSAMDAILDDVREASYDVMPRQSAFLIRAACAAVEHVACAFDPESSAQTALMAILRAQNTGAFDDKDLTAA